MPTGLPLPARGRHARPRRAGQPLAAGLLGLSLLGGTTALAATSAPLPSTPVVLAAGTGATAAASVLEQSREQRLMRASRARPPAPAPPPPPEPEPAPPAPPVLPGCTGTGTTQYANGRIPSSALCALPGHPGHRLQPDAARALVALAEAYRADTGRGLCITDTYRSYDAQVRLRWAKRGLAAAPGRSNHGTGTAVDFCGGVESFGTSAHRWMRARAAEFGWVHPSWARPGGRKPEPWHWEFRP